MLNSMGGGMAHVYRQPWLNAQTGTASYQMQSPFGQTFSTWLSLKPPTAQILTNSAGFSHNKCRLWPALLTYFCYLPILYSVNLIKTLLADIWICK